MAEESQTAVAEKPQTAPVTDAQTEQAAPTDGQAADESRGAAFDYSQIDEEWLSNALSKSEVLQKRLRQEQDNGFNAGKQRRDKELRLERGSEEVARAVQERWRNKYGVELDDEDKREAPLWAAANRAAARVEVARSRIQSELDAFEPDDRDKIAQAMDRLDDDPDTMEQLFAEVSRVARTRTASRHVSELDFSELLKQPEATNLRRGAEAWVQEQVEKELKARAAERETPPNPPPTPAGSVASGRIPQSLNELRQLSREQVTSLRKSVGDERWYEAIRTLR